IKMLTWKELPLIAVLLIAPCILFWYISPETFKDFLKIQLSSFFNLIFIYIATRIFSIPSKDGLKLFWAKKKS
ncbi:hypothetical protein BgiBS90_025933, partial [Biomphalaria glabrata]